MIVFVYVNELDENRTSHFFRDIKSKLIYIDLIFRSKHYINKL